MPVYPVQTVLKFARQLKSVLGLVPIPDLQVNTELQPVLIANPPEIPANVTIDAGDLNVNVENPIRTFPNIENLIDQNFISYQRAAATYNSAQAREYTIPFPSIPNISGKTIRVRFVLDGLVQSNSVSGFIVTFKFYIMTQSGTAFEDMLYAPMIPKASSTNGFSFLLVDERVDYAWEFPQSPSGIILNVKNISPFTTNLTLSHVFCNIVIVGQDLRKT